MAIQDADGAETGATVEQDDLMAALAKYSKGEGGTVQLGHNRELRRRGWLALDEKYHFNVTPEGQRELDAR